MGPYAQKTAIKREIRIFLDAPTKSFVDFVYKKLMDLYREGESVLTINKNQESNFLRADGKRYLQMWFYDGDVITCSYCNKKAFRDESDAIEGSVSKSDSGFYEDVQSICHECIDKKNVLVGKIESCKNNAVSSKWFSGWIVSEDNRRHFFDKETSGRKLSLKPGSRCMFKSVYKAENIPTTKPSERAVKKLYAYNIKSVCTE